MYQEVIMNNENQEVISLEQMTPAEIIELVKEVEKKQVEWRKNNKTKAARTLAMCDDTNVDLIAFANYCALQKSSSVAIVKDIKRDILEQVFTYLGRDLPEGVETFNLHFIGFRDKNFVTYWIGVSKSDEPGLIKIGCCPRINTANFGDITRFRKLLENYNESLKYIHCEDTSIDVNHLHDWY